MKDLGQDAEDADIPISRPGVLVRNMGEPIRLTGLNLAGVSAETAREGGTVEVWTRMALTSDQELFQRITPNLASVLDHTAGLAGQPTQIARTPRTAVWHQRDRDHRAMTRHGPFQSRHPVTALPAFRPLTPTTSSATSTLAQTTGLARHPWLTSF